MKEQFRQGDVFLERSEIEFSKDSEKFDCIQKDKGKTILAYGEATGHAHAITSDSVNYFKEKNTNRLYLIVDNTEKLKHEEHKEIDIFPGIYEVIRQREYTPEEIRYVLD